MNGASPSLESVHLRSQTSPHWLPQAIARFDEVLIDHAHCEKKAAANALSLLQAYPDIPGLAAEMAAIAREESSHLVKVLALFEERGLTLSPDLGDPYAQKLQALVRKPTSERRLDRLLIAAVIEARSCERLGLLATELPQASLRRFYRELTNSEHGHQRLFVRLAARLHGDEPTLSRLDELLIAEARILSEVGVRAAVH